MEGGDLSAYAGVAESGGGGGAVGGERRRRGGRQRRRAPRTEEGEATGEEVATRTAADRQARRLGPGRWRGGNVSKVWRMDSQVVR